MVVRRVTAEADWQHARAIRQRVFVEEQACPPEEEWDEHDWPAAHAVHLLAEIDGEAAGTARWRPASIGRQRGVKLERFAVLPAFRGRGVGRALIAAAIEDAAASGARHFVLHAQAHLESLYASFGFTREGEVFDEAGIPHVRMVMVRGDEPSGAPLAVGDGVGDP
jgi:predicted GNAT family N-acyltransferase